LCRHRIFHVHVIADGYLLNEGSSQPYRIISRTPRTPHDTQYITSYFFKITRSSLRFHSLLISLLMKTTSPLSIYWCIVTWLTRIIQVYIYCNISFFCDTLITDLGDDTLPGTDIDLCLLCKYFLFLISTFPAFYYLVLTL